MNKKNESKKEWNFDPLLPLLVALSILYVYWVYYSRLYDHFFEDHVKGYRPDLNHL